MSSTEHPHPDLEVESGEIRVSTNGDVVIGAPTAVAIVVIPQDEEE